MRMKSGIVLLWSVLMSSSRETRLKIDKLSKVYAKMSGKELVKAWLGRRDLNKIEYEVLSRAINARRTYNGGWL